MAQRRRRIVRGMLPYLHRSSPPLTALTEGQRTLAAALRRDVQVLAGDIGPRGWFAPDRYALAADFIESALVKAAYSVKRQWMEEFGVRACNLEAVLPGSRNPERVLIVGAHYDSVGGCPAANDNGSGVAGVLALARSFTGRPGACTIRFVLFANEEPPFFNFNVMGSQVYARQCHKEGTDVRGMISLETIGYYSDLPNSQQWPHATLGYILPTVGNFVTFVGPTSAKSFISRAAEAFEEQRAFRLVAAAAPASIDQINWSDHRGFNEVGYPAFMVTDTAPLRYSHYHLPTDTPDQLDYESMARVVGGLCGMLRTLADAC